MVSEVTCFLDGIFSNDSSRQIESAAKINKFLLKNMPETGERSVELIPLDTQQLIDPGVIRRFVEFLHMKDSPVLPSLAAEALSIIAAIKPDLVVDQDPGPKLVKLIASPRDYIRDPALLALANVAADPVHHDYLLKSGALMPLLNLLSKDTNNFSTLRAATLTLCNLCRGNPPPTFEEVKHALELHLHSNDGKVLENVCSAIQYLCNGSEDGIQSVIDAGFVPKLVQLLQHPSPSVLIPVPRIIDTIVSKHKDQIQCVIDYGALRIISDLFNRDYDKKVKGATFLAVISITSGFREHIQAVIDENWIPKLVSLAQNDELGLKKEAVWGISNATLSGSHEQIINLVEQGCIRPLCDFLIHPDPLIISACLNGLEKILEVGVAVMNIGGGNVNNYAQQIEDAEGLGKIENMQHHENYEISEKAFNILTTYW